MGKGRVFTPIQPGTKFTRLIVLGHIRVTRADGTFRTLTECRCDCGKTIQALSGNLRRRLVQSCGCLNRENASKTALTVLPAFRVHLKHGHSTRVRSTATYRTWRMMIARCHSPNATKYDRYGGSGISVCKAWRDDFRTFLNDMGVRPEGTTIDRIDGRFGYFFANCRWATPAVQYANRRTWRNLFHARFPALKKLLDERPTC